MNIAKPSKTLPQRLAVLLFVDAITITLILVAIFHGTWIRSRWRMLNGYPWHWNLGVLSVEGYGNCDAVNEQAFHAVCMAVFKNAVGSLDNVRSMICGLQSWPLKIDPQFYEAATVFSASCDDVSDVLTWSTIFVCLSALAATATLLAAMALVRLAYKKFMHAQRSMLVLAVLLRFIALILLLSTSIAYPNKMIGLVPKIWDYGNRDGAEAAPIESISSATELGGGVFMVWAATLLTVLAVVLTVIWIPVVKNDVMRRKATQAVLPPARSPSAKLKESFWAYMPEVFQPDIYVAELSEPAVVAYEPTGETTWLNVGQPQYMPQ